MQFVRFIRGANRAQWLIKNARKVSTTHKDYGRKLILRIMVRGRWGRKLNSITRGSSPKKFRRGRSDGECVRIDTVCRLFPVNWISFVATQSKIVKNILQKREDKFIHIKWTCHSTLYKQTRTYFQISSERTLFLIVSLDTNLKRNNSIAILFYVDKANLTLTIVLSSSLLDSVEYFRSILVNLLVNVSKSKRIRYNRALDHFVIFGRNGWRCH